MTITLRNGCFSSIIASDPKKSWVCFLDRSQPLKQSLALKEHNENLHKYFEMKYIEGVKNKVNIFNALFIKEETNLLRISLISINEISTTKLKCVQQRLKRTTTKMMEPKISQISALKIFEKMISTFCDKSLNFVIRIMQHDDCLNF